MQLSKYFRLTKSFISVFTALSSLTAKAGAEALFTQQTKEGDALRLPVCSWTDSSKPTKALILAIHGATLYSGNFDAPARHLSSQGYPVYALDMRGFGRWRSENAKFSGDSGIHYTQSREDLESVLKRLREENPDTKIICLGESIGANLAVWLASTRPYLLDGMILTSPCIKAWFHPMFRMPFDTVKGLLAPNKRHHTRPYIDKWLSDDRRVTEAYFDDPVIVHELSPAEMVKSIKTNKLTLESAKDVPRAMPVLIVAGKKDYIYKAAAIPLFALTLGSQNKTIVIEPNKGHLLLETKYVEPKVLSVIDNWLAAAICNAKISRLDISISSPVTDTTEGLTSLIAP